MIVPYVSISPTHLSIYNQWQGQKRSSQLVQKTIKNLKCNKRKQRISKQSKKKIQQSINWLMFQAKKKSYIVERTGSIQYFKVNFITLTLPAKQQHSDQVIKTEIFEKWLTEMRNLNLMGEYVWRAELQDNGNIHFHIATDTY